MAVRRAVCIERCPHGSGGSGLYAYLPHDSYNTSENRGQSQSYGMNYQKLGKDLMSQDEIAVMDGGKCICQLRGVRPFLSAKFDITRHPRYKFISDFDKKNAFDVEKYLAGLRRPRPPVKPDEQFDLYEIEDEPGDSTADEAADTNGEVESDGE